jgi:hypothetical protein
LARALGLTNNQLEQQIYAAVRLHEEQLALIDPVYAAVRAQRDYEAALADVVDLEKEGERGTLEYVEALLAAELAFFKLESANAAAGVSLDGYIGTLNTSIEAGRLTVEQVELIVAALQAQGHELDLLDGRVIRTRHEHTVVTTEISGQPGRVGDRPEMRANGGSITAGRTYLVGERGPELIVPGASGHVMPAGQTAAALSGATYNVTVQMPPGADGNQVVAALRRWERANGPVPVGVR